MDLQGLSSIVCTKIGQTDAASVAACQNYIRQRYALIYDRAFWRDARMQASDNTVVGQNYINLPAGMDRVESIRYGGNRFPD